MAVAVERPRPRSPYRSRSYPRLSNSEMRGSRAWFAQSTPGSRVCVMATNPCYATVGMELGDNHMILHNHNKPHHPAPGYHRCSPSVAIDLWMSLQQYHARERPGPTPCQIQVQNR